MKTNFNKSLSKNKPIHIHSVFYPAPGFVAMPQNKLPALKEKKGNKKKGLQHEPGSIIALVKETIYNMVSICKNRQKS